MANSPDENTANEDDQLRDRTFGSDSALETAFADIDEKSSKQENEEIADFNPAESIYELEPFVLPGEKITQEVPVVSLNRDSLRPQERPAFDKRPQSFVSEPSRQVGPQEGQAEPLESQQLQMIEAFKKRREEFAESALLDPLLNSVIAGKYEIFDVIGYGNMAVVYKVQDLSTGEVYAAKTCKPEAEEEDHKRFQLEISTHSILRHENIVGFVETIQTDTGDIFLILENVKGLSLEEVIEIHGPIMQVENIWNILRPICEALEHAHALGIVHRDLKSGNIILSKDENSEMKVKILDFGIAKNYDDKAFKITNPGRSVGSPLYMSPEQIRGEKLTSASDIYALGILAYEIVTGRPPYMGKSLMEVINKHCAAHVKPPSIKELGNELPNVEIYERVVRKALETDPELRIESATEFKLVLSDWFKKAMV